MTDVSILIVEDEGLIALEISTRLEELGYNVIGIAASASEAYCALDKRLPDIILMDIRINGSVDGIEAAEHIKEKYKIPVIYITAYASQETIERAKKTNPYGYLVKPIQERDLRITLEMALHKIAIEQEAERKLIQNTIEVEESERNRYSRELHDNLGPLLATIKLYFQWLSETNNPDKISIITEKGLQNIDKAIHTVRDMSHNLSPVFLREKGFFSSLQSFIDDINEVNKIRFKYDSNINIRLDKTIEISLYRIVTELINNTIKHARASEVIIICSHIEEKRVISLCYKDNGVGFDMKTILKHPAGLGLMNIESRVQSLNGTLMYQTAIGEGVDVRVDVPFFI
jgi:signal transduction histidine kinase